MRHGNLEYVPLFQGHQQFGIVGLVHAHYQNAVGRRWEFEGTAKRSNAGVGSLRMGLHGFVGGDRGVSRGGWVGRRVV